MIVNFKEKMIVKIKTKESSTKREYYLYIFVVIMQNSSSFLLSAKQTD